MERSNFMVPAATQCADAVPSRPGNIGERLSRIADIAYELRTQAAMAVDRMAGPSPSNLEKQKEPDCVMAHLELIESVLATSVLNLNRINQLI